MDNGSSDGSDSEVDATEGPLDPGQLSGEETSGTETTESDANPDAVSLESSGDAPVVTTVSNATNPTLYRHEVHKWLPTSQANKISQAALDEFWESLVEDYRMHSNYTAKVEEMKRVQLVKDATLQVCPGKALDRPMLLEPPTPTPLALCYTSHIGGGQHPPNFTVMGTTECGACRRRRGGTGSTRNTGRSGRQNTATRRSARREERVTVQGPVKKQQPDGMSHGGGGQGAQAALVSRGTISHSHGPKTFLPSGLGPDLPLASAKPATTEQVGALLSHAPDATGSY